MSSRSLNKVILIGNSTADAILRYTATNDAICTFSLATNRSWTTEKGEKKEETEFHRIVAWSKLAEICAQLIKKGAKLYLEGRISSKTVVREGVEHTYFEIVLEDMILLERPRVVEVKKEVTSDILPPTKTP